MHNYAGNPANYPGTIPLVDDADLNPPTAANIDLTGQALADRSAFIFQRARTPNFQPSSSPSALFALLGALHAVCWDTKDLRWLIGGQEPSGGGAVVAGRGDPNAWAPSASGSSWGAMAGGSWTSLVRGNEPGISSKYYYGAYVTSGLFYIGRADTVGVTHALATRPGGTGGIGDVKLATRSGILVCAVGASGAGNSQVYYSANSGTSWTAQASALVIATAIPSWLLASNPSGQVLAIPGIVGPPTYISSPDGTTWTARTGLSSVSGGVIGGSELPTALIWGFDANLVGCWLLTTYDGGLTGTYRSYDGVAWSKVTNSLPAGTPIGKLALMSDPLILLALVTETPIARVLYSLDGGATWRQTSTEVVISGGTVSLAAGPNQACIVTGGYIVPGIALGDPGGIGPV